MNKLRDYAAHRADCGWLPSYHAPDGLGQPCRCGVITLLLSPPGPLSPADSAFRPFVCHDRTCAWSRSVEHGLARADCDCGLARLLARLGPSDDPAIRQREAQMADPALAHPPGYQVY